MPSRERIAADRKAKWTIGAVVCAFALIIGLKIITGKSKGDCLNSASTNTVILIDRSDRLAAQTRDEIIARVRAHVLSRPVNERVTIFAVNDSAGNSLVPLVSVCRPERGAEGSQLSEDVRLLDKRFDSLFLAPIIHELDRPIAASHSSPIAQAITDISLSTYLTGTENHLLIFSDMLENTVHFSAYRCPAPNEIVPDFRAARAGALERPTFRNTSVVINIIPRADLSPSTLKCRDVLWPWFFGDMQGKTAGLDVRYLPGG